MSNCHSDSTQRVKDHVAKQLPAGAVGLDVEMQGYVFGMAESGSLTHRAACPVTIEYQAPKKGKGSGMKTVKQKSFLRARFCPFCGEAYDKSEEAEPCGN